MENLETLWLIRPKPRPLEALSSWIVRLAAANGQGLHSFSTDHWPNVALWTRDLDHLAPEAVLDTLMNGVGVSAAQAKSTTFSAYQGILFEGDDPISHFSYVRPLGVYHRLRRAFGQQYCSACLAMDPAPYFRLTWRLCLFPLCTRHGKILLDRCHNCGNPAIPHRGDMLRCHVCRVSLADFPQQDADSSAIMLQRTNETILDGHAITQPAELLGHHPLLYFRLLLCLASVLFLGRRRNRFRASVSEFLPYPLPAIPDDQRTPLRFANPEASHEIMRAIATLMVGWPWRFIGAAQEAGLWHSWAYRDMNPIFAPCAYVTPVQVFLRIDANEAKRI